MPIKNLTQIVALCALLSLDATELSESDEDALGTIVTKATELSTGLSTANEQLEARTTELTAMTEARDALATELTSARARVSELEAATREQFFTANVGVHFLPAQKGVVETLLSSGMTQEQVLSAFPKLDFQAKGHDGDGEGGDGGTAGAPGGQEKENIALRRWRKAAELCAARTGKDAAQLLSQHMAKPWSGFTRADEAEARHLIRE